MKFWYDTEFLEDGKTIELISIGIVAENGDQFYAVNEAVGEDPLYDRIRRHKWLMENVVPSLPLRAPLSKPFEGNPPHFRLDYQSTVIMPKRMIANGVREFLQAGAPVELWGYYSAYDHVLLAQLWGPMIKLPPGIPMWTNDVRQLAEQLALSANLPPQVGTKHNALDDAQWTRTAWEYLNSVGRVRVGADDQVVQ